MDDFQTVRAVYERCSVELIRNKAAIGFNAVPCFADPAARKLSVFANVDLIEPTSAKQRSVGLYDFFPVPCAKAIGVDESGCGSLARP